MSTRILDHIPHLTPPGTLSRSVAAFQQLGFTVIPGGTHADGATANALVVFADGTYLELIHFVQPPPPDSRHPWARRAPGWIDYAFLGTGRTGPDSIAQTINERARQEGSPVLYEEARGGRRREDGRVLEWLISSPSEHERGKLPFFCGDVTPREWRVPLEPRSNVEHENTAVGIAYVRLLVSSEAYEVSARQLTTVIGQHPSVSSDTETHWELEQQPSHYGAHQRPPLLVLQVADGNEEREYLQTHGPGIYEVGFRVTEESNTGIAQTPYGRLVWTIR